MRESGRGVAIAALLLTAVAILGHGLGTGTEHVGQVVFVPGDPGTSMTSPVGAVTVTFCEQTPEGLLVQGRVEPVGQLTSVLVSRGDPNSSGVAVSAGYAASAGVVPGAVPGDFQVTLSWATSESTFAIVDPEALAAGGGAPAAGPPSACPG